MTLTLPPKQQYVSLAISKTFRSHSPQLLPPIRCQQTTQITYLYSPSRGLSSEAGTAATASVLREQRC